MGISHLKFAGIKICNVFVIVIYLLSPLNFWDMKIKFWLMYLIFKWIIRSCKTSSILNCEYKLSLFYRERNWTSFYSILNWPANPKVVILRWLYLIIYPIDILIFIRKMGSRQLLAESNRYTLSLKWESIDTYSMFILFGISSISEK